MRDKVRQSTTFFLVQGDKSIMFQRNKNEADVFLDLIITFKYFVCLKKIQSISNVFSFNLTLFRTKVDIKSVIRDYSLRNYVVNV